ncbi:MAG: amino acid permease [Rhodanobacter sp.]|nr:MAG: amino acid permease [Rhodanobacter sp.]
MDIRGGIFLNPGIAAQRTGSGLSLLPMWVGAGVLTLIGALCYAELGARRPQTGGSYVYLREAFGPLAGFLFGWTMLPAVATLFRYRRHDTGTLSFRVPGYPWLPLLFIGIVAFVVVMTIHDSPHNAGIGALIMLAGVPVYAVWRRLFSHAGC